jgi:hypothetical protein
VADLPERVSASVSLHARAASQASGRPGGQAVGHQLASQPPLRPCGIPTARGGPRPTARGGTQTNPTQAGAPRRRLRARPDSACSRAGEHEEMPHETRSSVGGCKLVTADVGVGRLGLPISGGFRRGPAAWRLPVYRLRSAARCSAVEPGASSAVCCDSATALSKRQEKNRRLCLPSFSSVGGEQTERGKGGVRHP